jgi:hypothetical protein
MAIETLDDILEQLADWVGVYGAHDTDEPRPGFSSELHCRVCFTSTLRQRIMGAVTVEGTYSPAVCRSMAKFWQGLAEHPPSQSDADSNAR